MKQLSPIIGPPIERYDAIAKLKHGPRRRALTSLRSVISARYMAYQQHASRLEALQEVRYAAGDAAALRHCFESPTSALDALVREIRTHLGLWGSSVCPYCGINAPNTVEHYLPRATFPEYSVFQDNLIPACGECNGYKGDRWREGTGRRNIHFYFDHLPSNVQWLHAKITLTAAGPEAEYSVAVAAGLTSRELELVGNHVSSLHLLDRYGKRAAAEFAEALESTPQNIPPADLSTAWTYTGRGRQHLYGVNDWKAVLSFAIAQSPPTLSWLHVNAR